MGNTKELAIKRKLALQRKWERLIKKCQTSPLLIAEFAKKQNVGEPNLYKWAQRLGSPLRLQSNPDKLLQLSGTSDQLQTNIEKSTTILPNCPLDFPITQVISPAQQGKKLENRRSSKSYLKSQPILKSDLYSIEIVIRNFTINVMMPQDDIIGFIRAL